MTERDQKATASQYETLRRKLEELDSQAEQIDAELVKLERELPDDYVYPGEKSSNRA